MAAVTFRNRYQNVVDPALVVSVRAPPRTLGSMMAGHRGREDQVKQLGEVPDRVSIRRGYVIEVMNMVFVCRSCSGIQIPQYVKRSNVLVRTTSWR